MDGAKVDDYSLDHSVISEALSVIHQSISENSVFNKRHDTSQV